MTKFDAHKWIKEFKSGKLNELETDRKGAPVKGFQPGDMWRNDFDYVGMLRYSAEMVIPEDLMQFAQDDFVQTLKDLFESYTDVNYHTEAADLGNAIDWMEDPGQDANQAQERIEDFLTSFRRACMKTLKSWKIKWAPDPSIERELRG